MSWLKKLFNTRDAERLVKRAKRRILAEWESMPVEDRIALLGEICRRSGVKPEITQAITFGTTLYITAKPEDTP